MTSLTCGENTGFHHRFGLAVASLLYRGSRGMQWLYFSQTVISVIILGLTGAPVKWYSEQLAIFCTPPKIAT